MQETGNSLSAFVNNAPLDVFFRKFIRCVGWHLDHEQCAEGPMVISNLSG
jgi:hypothetical protein